MSLLTLFTPTTDGIDVVATNLSATNMVKVSRVAAVAAIVQRLRSLLGIGS